MKEGGLMKQKKYIVWDWNGTLFDDIDVCMKSLNELLERYHLPLVDKTSYRNVFRFPVKDYYRDVGFDFDRTSFDILANQYMKRYIPLSMNCSLFQDVQETLAHFKQFGLKQYIISASRMDHLQSQLAQYDILPYFEDILGLDNICAYSKVDVAVNWIQNQHIHTDEVLFIGDSVHDSEVAKACGCECILISRGHQSREKLEKTGCIVKDSISQLWKEEFGLKLMKQDIFGKAKEFPDMKIE